VAGVFITRGMTVSIPPDGLQVQVRPDGSLEASPLVIHVRTDVAHTWMAIARSHMTESQAARSDRIQAWESDNEQAKAAALDREAVAAMQAIMAAAIAVDAFYARIQLHVKVPEDQRKAWLRNRTARYKQVSEVIRVAGNLKPNEMKSIRKSLEELYRFRGWAVHPPQDLRAPVSHPDHNVGVEWRFVAFRADNAAAAVAVAMSLFQQLAARADRVTIPEVRKYLQSLDRELKQILGDDAPGADESA
jgi:hypothetical protein